jgi:hypothetical protein
MILMIQAWSGKAVVIARPQDSESFEAAIQEGGLQIDGKEEFDTATLGFKEQDNEIVRIPDPEMPPRHEVCFRLTDPEHSIFGIANKWVKTL